MKRPHPPAPPLPRGTGGSRAAEPASAQPRSTEASSDSPLSPSGEGGRGGEFQLFPWPGPLLGGTLLGRYHRFLAQVRLDEGPVVVAHCVNSGTMEGLVEPGARVFLTKEHKPGRKLGYTWQWMCSDGVAVGTNTHLPNPLVGSLLAARALPGFEEHRGFRAEVPYGKHSRVDFLVELPEGPAYLEVKNCHLVYPDGGAYFPDSVSTRATEHLRELARLARKGTAARVCFTVQREDARFVCPSELHDPDFAKAARAAHKAGVRFQAVRLRPEPEGLRLLGALPVSLERCDLERMRAWRGALAGRSGWRREPVPEAPGA